MLSHSSWNFSWGAVKDKKYLTMNYFRVPWLLHHRCNFQACWSKKFKTLAATALDVWAGYGMVANPRKAEPLAYLACTQIQYSLHKHKHSTAQCALHILLHKHRYKYEYIQAKATLCQGHGKDMLQFIKEKDTNTRKKYRNTEHLLWLIWLIVLWTFCERWWQQKEKERDTAPALEDPLGLLDKAETSISLILLQYFSDAATLFVWFCNVYFSDSLCPISMFLPFKSWGWGWLLRLCPFIQEIPIESQKIHLHFHMMHVAYLILHLCCPPTFTFIWCIPRTVDIQPNGEFISLKQVNVYREKRELVNIAI